jgi:predicted component of type VI protein secretion system
MQLLTIAILSLMLTGCSERVQVVDAAGKPVQGAQVAPVTLSMNGAPAVTDARGEASVPLRIGVQETKWVNISKPGFETIQVDVPAEWPLKVVLQPAKGP